MRITSEHPLHCTRSVPCDSALAPRANCWPQRQGYVNVSGGPSCASSSSRSTVLAMRGGASLARQVARCSSYAARCPGSLSVSYAAIIRVACGVSAEHLSGWYCEHVRTLRTCVRYAARISAADASGRTPSTAYASVAAFIIVCVEMYNYFFCIHMRTNPTYQLMRAEYSRIGDT